MKGLGALLGLLLVPLFCGGTIFVMLFVVFIGGAAMQMPAWAQDDVTVWMVGNGRGYGAAAGIGVGWDGYAGPGGMPGGVPFDGKPYLNCYFHDPIYPGHTGIDFPMGQGTPVNTTMAGKVVWAGANGGWGNLVVVENNGIQTYYAHLSAIHVTQGEVISDGEKIGLVGSTGNSTGPHLHYGVKQKTENGQVWLDPIDFIGEGDYIKTRCPP